MILLSADQPASGATKYLADIQERQRRYIDSLDNRRFERVQGRHIVQAEQPELVAARIRELLPAT